MVLNASIYRLFIDRRLQVHEHKLLRVYSFRVDFNYALFADIFATRSAIFYVDSSTASTSIQPARVLKTSAGV